MAVQQGFKYFTIKIEPDLHQKIKEFCVKRGITMREFALQSFDLNMAEIGTKLKNEKQDSKMDNHEATSG
jgi:hypothetical protein